MSCQPNPLSNPGCKNAESCVSGGKTQNKPEIPSSGNNFQAQNKIINSADRGFEQSWQFVALQKASWISSPEIACQLKNRGKSGLFVLFSKEYTIRNGCQTHCVLPAWSSALFALTSVRVKEENILLRVSQKSLKEQHFRCILAMHPRLIRVSGRSATCGLEMTCLSGAHHPYTPTPKIAHCFSPISVPSCVSFLCYFCTQSQISLRLSLVVISVQQMPRNVRISTNSPLSRPFVCIASDLSKTKTIFFSHFLASLTDSFGKQNKSKSAEAEGTL